MLEINCNTTGSEMICGITNFEWFFFVDTIILMFIIIWFIVWIFTIKK